MNANLDLVPVKESPRLRGFTNLFRKENKSWWFTRRWWINALIWPVLLCGLLANILFVPTIAGLATEAEIARAGNTQAYLLSLGISVFFEFGFTALTVGIVILSQDLIIGEKQNGVAEWLLSKPIARRSFILSKAAASIAPMVILMLGLPSLLAYCMFSIQSRALYPVGPFLAGTGIMLLGGLFYLSLTIMLGVIFNNRAAVLGIALGSILGGSFLGGTIKPLLYLTPWMLPKYASLAASGQSFPSQLGLTPLLAAAAGILAFLFLGLLVFEKSEY